MMWQSLTLEQRNDWERASKQAHLQITGYNLFTYYVLTNDDAAIVTVERDAGVDLIPLQRYLP